MLSIVVPQAIGISLHNTMRISNYHHMINRKTWKDMKLMFKCQTDRVIWQGAIPTSLPPLATSCRRTPKCIEIDESLIGSLEGTLSKRIIAYQTQQILVNYFDSKCDGDKCRLFISSLKSRSMTVVRKNLRIKMINSLTKFLCCKKFGICIQ